jgi:O-antigen/teichoic acid export membrane protein
VLALRGAGELVALWAQLASLMELVSGVAIAGLGPGLAVYVARTKSAERQRELLREAVRLGLSVSLPFALAAALVGWLAPRAIGGEAISSGVLVLAAAVGCLGVLPGLVVSLWLGQERRDAQLALALASALLSVAVALWAPRDWVLVLLVSAQASLVVVVLLVGQPAAEPGRFRSRSHPLRRYILPSLSIGLFSPASTLVARAAVGDALSWQDAGVLQALWRVQDWVYGFAGGVLSVYYLPQLAAARDSERFDAVFAAAFKRIVIPSAGVLLVLYAGQRQIMALLYDDSFRASDLAAGLFLLGALARIAAWVPLFGLYAKRRTLALAAGELLSLPLFAVLVLLAGKHLTLELAGALWLVAYSAYFVFNLWALRR